MLFLDLNVTFCSFTFESDRLPIQLESSLFDVSESELLNDDPEDELLPDFCFYCYKA